MPTYLLTYFVSCLEQGWFKDVTLQPKKHDPYELNTEQKQWYEWASSNGLCDGRLIRHYGLMSGELGMIVFEPEFKCYATMPLSRAMQKYPMDKRFDMNPTPALTLKGWDSYQGICKK